MTQSDFTDEQLAVMGERLSEIFNLRRDPWHKDRWKIEGGSKTNIGVAATFLRIASEINDGVPPHKLFH